MAGSFYLYLGLIVIMLLLIMLANRLKVAYPVILVLAGLLLSLWPGIPTVNVDPELIFVIFLPPLLYDAAWKISWKELWHWRRLIGSFAFIVVFLTALAVALAANCIIPGFSLALGFLLGGIVSPPDAVSAGAILKFVKVPQRISAILEGESLLNDASSLIIFRFAMLSAATGQFIWHDAVLSFVWMVAGGLCSGLLVGFLIMKVQEKLPTDVNMDIILTLLSPYALYIAGEAVGSSGVLAVVAGGLLLSNHRLEFLTSTARLRTNSVWESLAFLLNGLVFMLIGLDLPQITSGLEQIGLPAAIGYGLLVTLVLIVTRFLSIIGAVAITLFARNYISVADRRHPGIKGPFVLGWAGMRGVVSLAAALSIPTVIADGTEFPERNLIIFITFVVILTTLLLQGLTLPFIIERFKLTDPDYDTSEEEMYNKLRTQLSQVAFEYLTKRYQDQVSEHPLLQQMAQEWQLAAEELESMAFVKESQVIYREILQVQRDWLIKQNHGRSAIIEEVIRRHLFHIDLEEEKSHFL